MAYTSHYADHYQNQAKSGESYDRSLANRYELALEHRRFIPSPQSGLESLAHGLKAAILRLQDQYSAYQANTQHYIAYNFSPAIHLALDRQLYRTMA